MARLYANENFPFDVVEALRNLGHDVLTTLDTDRAGQAISDEEVLAFATFDERAVLTLNRKDFRKLHQAEPHHAGIVICTFDSEFHSQAVRIHETLMMISNLSGQLIRVNRPPK